MTRRAEKEDGEEKQWRKQLRSYRGNEGEYKSRLRIQLVTHKLLIPKRQC